MAKVMAAAPRCFLRFRVPRPSPFWGFQAPVPNTCKPRRMTFEAMFTIEGALKGRAGFDPR
jgi:hypothetical protein